MSSSNQRPANRGFRSVLRCAITHYRQFPWLSAPEPLYTLGTPAYPCQASNSLALAPKKSSTTVNLRDTVRTIILENA